MSRSTHFCVNLLFLRFSLHISCGLFHVCWEQGLPLEWVKILPILQEWMVVILVWTIDPAEKCLKGQQIVAFWIFFFFLFFCSFSWRNCIQFRWKDIWFRFWSVYFTTLPCKLWHIVIENTVTRLVYYLLLRCLYFTCKWITTTSSLLYKGH